MADADNKHRLAPTIEDKDLYKNVLDTRNFEISFFWQRSNYFLVLNSALALGFFGLKTRSYEPWLAGFGLLVSLLWPSDCDPEVSRSSRAATLDHGRTLSVLAIKRFLRLIGQGG